MYILYVYLSLSGTGGAIFDLIKGVAINKESYQWSERVRSATECSSVCQSDSGCKAINYIDGICELHKGQEDCPFEYNSPTVVKNESVKAYVKRDKRNKSSTGLNDKINWMEHAIGDADCNEGQSHDYKGYLNIHYRGPSWGCQVLNSNYPNEVLEKPVNQLDHSTNYCRATEMNGDIWCTSNRRATFRAELKCNVVQCSQCNLMSDMPSSPNNSKPGKLSAMFHPLVTFGCKSFGSGETVEHCPVSVCKDNKWSLNFSLSCSYIDCYDVSYEYKGKMSCTVSGIPCQKWNTNNPHLVVERPRESEDLNTNFCRDDPTKPEGTPWCYTIDPRVRWQICPVPKCVPWCDPCLLPSPPNTRRIMLETDLAVFECVSFNAVVTKVDHCPVSRCTEKGWSSTMVSCSFGDCFIDSTSYNGKVNCTSKGVPCQRWNESSPHIPSNFAKQMDPEDISTNYCRDPDRTGAPWCYTTDSNKRWDFCPVKKCS